MRCVVQLVKALEMNRKPITLRTIFLRLLFDTAINSTVRVERREVGAVNRINVGSVMVNAVVESSSGRVCCKNLAG